MVVAIQNSLTGAVITVLPLDYHERIAWKVSEDDILIARGKKPKKSNKKSIKKLLQLPPKVIPVKVHYYSEGSIKKLVLVKLDALEYENSITQVVEDTAFELTIERLCKENGIDLKSIREVSLSIGNKGEKFFLDWRYKYL